MQISTQDELGSKGKGMLLSFSRNQGKLQSMKLDWRPEGRIRVCQVDLGVFYR